MKTLLVGCMEFFGETLLVICKELIGEHVAFSSYGFVWIPILLSQRIILYACKGRYIIVVNFKEYR